MNIELKSIHCGEHSSEYEVKVSDGTSEKAFRLAVEEGEIQVVTWDEDLAVYVGQRLFALSPLFEAILAVHNARRLVLPLDHENLPVSETPPKK